MRRRDAVLWLPLLALVAGIVWFAVGRTPSRASLGDGSTNDVDDAAAPGSLGAADGETTLASGGRPKVKPKEPEPVAAVPTFPRSEGVFGRVLDARDTAIPGAKVTLDRLDPTLPGWWESGGEAVFTTDSGADGAYLVGPVTGGAFRWRVRVEASGFARAGTDVISKGSSIDFHLDRGGAVKVKVKDEAGAPVAKAVVRAGEDSPITRSLGTTDATGEVRLEGLALGGVEIAVECLGYGATTSNDVIVTANATAEKTVILRGAIQISGKVTDEANDKPVAGAIVTSRTGQGGSSSPIATTTTDVEGRFTLATTGRAGMNVEVTARKEGLGSSTTYTQLQASAAPTAGGGPPMGGGGGMNVLLRLGKSAGISGTVVDVDSRPVANAVVVFANAAGQRGLGESMSRTDPEGKFTLDLPPGLNRDGTYAIAAYEPTKGLGAATITPSRTPTPVVRLLGVGSILGTVKGPDGSPAEGAVVQCYMDQRHRTELPPASTEFQPWQYEQAMNDPRLATMGAATGADGHFRIESVPTGAYAAWVSWRGMQVSSTTTLSVRPGGSATLDVTLKSGGVIEGHVIDSESKPIAGANVAGWDPQNTQPGENRSSQSRSDADGRFVLRGVLGEHWSVQASATGFLNVSLPSVRAGDTTVELRMTPLGWIDGVVSGPDGKPFTGAFDAGATAASEGGGEASGSFSSADGAFRLRGLAAGEYVVSATTNEGLVPAAAPHANVVNGSGAGPIEIRLVRGASVTGTVLEDGSRRALSNAGVSLRIKGEATSGGRNDGWSSSDGRGRFSMVGLAAGTYTLAVTDSAGGHAEEELTLDAGQTVDRELLTRRPGAIAIRVVDTDGRPVAKARVNLRSENGAFIQVNWDALRKEGKVDFSRGGWEAAIATNDDGYLTRWHVPPGRVTVMVNRARNVALKHEPVTVEVASDRTTDVTVTVTIDPPGGR